MKTWNYKGFRIELRQVPGWEDDYVVYSPLGVKFFEAEVGKHFGGFQSWYEQQIQRSKLGATITLKGAKKLVDGYLSDDPAYSPHLWGAAPDIRAVHFELEPDEAMSFAGRKKKDGN